MFAGTGTTVELVIIIAANKQPADANRLAFFLDSCHHRRSGARVHLTMKSRPIFVYALMLALALTSSAQQYQPKTNFVYRHNRMTTAQENISIKPPVAKKSPKTTRIHGDTLVDDYYWMREK